MELEWQTRKNRIDCRLKAQGWQLLPWIERGFRWARSPGVAVAEFPAASGPADYALLVEGRLLGFIEAKNATVKLGRVGNLRRRKPQAQL